MRLSDAHYPEFVKTLTRLNDQMAKEDLSYRALYPSSSTSTSDLVYTIHDTVRYHPEYNPDSRLHLLVVSLNLTTSMLAEWVPHFKARMQSQADETPDTTLEYFDILSKVFNTRGMNVSFYKINGTYVVIETKETDTENVKSLYSYILATMLTQYNHDADFVRRASTALSKFDFLEYTKEELELIEEHKRMELLQDMDTAIHALTAPKDNKKTLEDLRNNIREVEQRLQGYYTALRKEEQYAFLLRTGMLTNQTMLDELQDYLTTASKNILRVKYSKDGRHDYADFTVKSFIRIPETDADFFKPETISNSRHILHNHPNIVKLLAGVMEQQIRLPIYAGYTINMYNNELNAIVGNDTSRDMRTYGSSLVGNYHVIRFDCFDGYKSMMRKAIINRDLIDFFEIMFQCTGTINVFDSVVMERIVEHITQLDKSRTKLLIRGDEGWNEITLEEYYETLED